MTLNNRAWIYSVALHLCLLLLALGVMELGKRNTKKYDLDFSVSLNMGSSGMAPGPTEAKPQPKAKVAPKPREKALKKRKLSQEEGLAKAKPEPKPELKPLEEPPRSPPQEPKQELAKLAEDAPDVPQVTDEAAPTDQVAQAERTDSTHQGMTPGEETEVRRAYLKKNREGIQNLLRGNFHYPPKAREMGWTGKVWVSFLLLLDGSVTELNLEKSSGHALLDRSALATIRGMGRLPRPERPLRVRLPISYKLN